MSLSICVSYLRYSICSVHSSLHFRVSASNRTKFNKLVNFFNNKHTRTNNWVEFNNVYALLENINHSYGNDNKSHQNIHRQGNHTTLTQITQINTPSKFHLKIQDLSHPKTTEIRPKTNDRKKEKILPKTMKNKET